MRRQPYTECKLYVDGIPLLAAGDFLRTSGGSAYCVVELMASRSRPHRRNLRCLRWPPDEIPADAKVFELHWYPRGKKQARRLS